MRRKGWVMVAAVAAIVAVAGLVDAVWGWAHGDHDDLVLLPIALLVWYWLALGAWRRARSTPS